MTDGMVIGAIAKLMGGMVVGAIANSNTWQQHIRAFEKKRSKDDTRIRISISRNSAFPEIKSNDWKQKLPTTPTTTKCDEDGDSVTSHSKLFSLDVVSLEWISFGRATFFYKFTSTMSF